MLLILGCWHHVCSFLASATILCIHRIRFEALFDASSAVPPLPPVGDPFWAGVAPVAVSSTATTLDVSVNATDRRVLYLPRFKLGVSPTSGSTTALSPRWEEWVWNSNLFQPPCEIAASSSGHAGDVGWIAPEPGVNLFDVTT
jgi:hypothetical protein